MNSLKSLNVVSVGEAYGQEVVHLIIETENGKWERESVAICSDGFSLPFVGDGPGGQQKARLQEEELAEVLKGIPIEEVLAIAREATDEWNNKEQTTLRLEQELRMLVRDGGLEEVLRHLVKMYSTQESADPKRKKHYEIAGSILEEFAQEVEFNR